MMTNGEDNSIYYLDDFLFVGRPDSSLCNQYLSVALHSCDDLGFQVAQEIEGPVTTLTFLDKKNFLILLLL